MSSPDTAAGGDLPAAVLWDMDGTLVDTEPYWIECEHQLVNEFGGTWTEHDAASLIGSDLLDTATTLRAAGVDLEPVALVNRLMDGVIERVGSRPAHGQPREEDLRVRSLYGYGRDWPITYSELAPWLLLGTAVASALFAGTTKMLMCSNRCRPKC